MNKYLILIVLAFILIIFTNRKLKKENFFSCNKLKYKFKNYMLPLELKLPKGYIYKSNLSNLERLNNIENEINILSIINKKNLKEIIKRQVQNIYLEDVNSIKVLQDASNELQKEKFVVNGDLNVLGKLNIKKDFIIKS